MAAHQAHANALLALIRAAAGSPALVVYPDISGNVPSGATPPYARVYVVVQSVGDDGLRETSGRVIARAVVHSVGANDIAARAVAGRVSDALLDVTPTIAGRLCFPIRHEDNVPPQRDESTGVVVIDQVDIYRLESVPA